LVHAGVPYSADKQEQGPALTQALPPLVRVRP